MRIDPSGGEPTLTPPYHPTYLADCPREVNENDALPKHKINNKKLNCEFFLN